jgi:serine/threonine protein kinase
MLPYTEVSVDAFESLVHEITVMRYDSFIFYQQRRTLLTKQPRSKLRHPNILLFLGACLSPKICIITELMPRGSLRDVVRSQQLNWTRKLNLAIEITRGLQYLHSQSPPVLHRDLKTLNILVDESFHIKLADFGATSAAVVRDGAADSISDGGETSSSVSSPSLSSQSLTAAENYGGTLYCLAPEVLDHQPYTPASDVYSLGLVFWELACGKVPFEGISNMRLLRAIEEGQIDSLDAVDPTCPSDYVELVKRCISKIPSDRLNLDEVMTLLKACKGAQT